MKKSSHYSHSLSTFFMVDWCFWTLQSDIIHCHSYLFSQILFLLLPHLWSRACFLCALTLRNISGNILDSLSCFFSCLSWSWSQQNWPFPISFILSWILSHIWPIFTALLSINCELSIPQDLGLSCMLSPYSGVLCPFLEAPQKKLIFRIHLYLLLFSILFLLHLFV